MPHEKILIAEDEKIIARDLRMRLEKAGYQIVAECTDYEEVLAAVQKEAPDLVIMDIVLEGEKDGILISQELLHRFNVPSVFLTAYADSETLERAKLAQPLGYIVKPFKERDLYTTVEIALYKAKVDRQLRDHDRWLDATLQGIGDAVIAIDRAQRIHYANSAALRLLGRGETEIVGERLSDVFSLVDEDTYMPVRLMELIQDNKQFSFSRVLLQIIDGTFYYVEGSLTRVEIENPPIGWVLVFRDVSQLKVLTQKIEHQSRYDSLTGLVNRREFTYLLTERFFDPRFKNRHHALIYLDLDQFKLINDTCGHLAGDELLRQVADILKKIGDNKVVASSRLGGDEFALLFEDTDSTQALEKAWMIKHALNSHEFIWQSNTFKVRASLGVIPFSNQYEDVKTILAAADDACYIAKEEGGNRIKVYETQEDRFQRRRGEMRWINRLTRALENNEFVLYFQTIIPLHQNPKLKTKDELLIRLRDEGSGQLIMPFDFIPAAERYNIMPQIDRWVIRTALGYFHKFREKHGRESMFSINLSGESLSEESLVNFIKHEIKKNQVPPENICFEITETAAVGNLANALGFIKELKSIGCAFSLDDFGSGLSSFAYLKNLPVDYIKIDGTFIKNLDNDPISQAMVEAVYKIGKAMHIHTVAEYVASAAIRDLLQRIGIDYAQGYEIARPEPLDD